MTKQENDSLRKHLIAAQSLAGASLAEARATLLKLTERYCVVYQTLTQAPPITVSLDQAEDAAADGD